MAKSFKDKMQQKALNPTLQFISQPETTPEPQEEPQTVEETRPKKNTTRRAAAPHRAPQTRRAQPEEETKSRRLQVLLTPSLYDDLRAAAAADHMSVNEMLNTILKDYLRK